MKRFNSIFSFLLLPYLAFTMTEHAQISLKVIDTRALTYNFRILPTENRSEDPMTRATLHKKEKNACSKTIYLENVAYQITALNPRSMTQCHIDTLGHSAYGIIMSEV